MTDLAPTESIGRVMDALATERDTMSGTPLAVLWADLRQELIGLRDGEQEKHEAMDRDIGLAPEAA